MHRHPRDVLAHHLDLAGVHTDAYVDAEGAHLVRDGEPRLDGTRWTVEHGKEPVAFSTWELPEQ